MPQPRERGNLELTHPPPKQVSRILLPATGTAQRSPILPLLPRPGQDLRHQRRALEATGRRIRLPHLSFLAPVPTVPPQFAYPPRSPPMTTPASAPSASRAAQSCPGHSARILSAALHAARATRQAWSPRLLFLQREGREEEGRELGGWDTAGRVECSRSLPPAPAWTLAEAECDGETAASLQNLPQPSTRKDPPVFPRGDRAPGGPVCIWVPGVCAWVLGLKKK